MLLSSSVAETLFVLGCFFFFFSFVDLGVGNFCSSQFCILWVAEGLLYIDVLFQ